MPYSMLILILFLCTFLVSGFSYSEITDFLFRIDLMEKIEYVEDNNEKLYSSKVYYYLRNGTKKSVYKNEITPESIVPLEKYNYNDVLFIKKRIVLRTWTNDLIMINKKDFSVMDVLNNSLDRASRISAINIPDERSLKERSDPSKAGNNDSQNTNTLSTLFVVCKNNSIVIYEAQEKLTMVQQYKNIPCTSDLVVSPNYLVTKYNKTLYVTKIMNNTLKLDRAIELEDAQTSKTYCNDDFAINNNDVIYAGISDKDELIGIDVRHDYIQSRLPFPFEEHDQLPCYTTHRIATYGNLLFIGCYMCNGGNGSVYMYNDNSMMEDGQYKPRFELLNKETSPNITLFGYSLAVSHDYYYIGGILDDSTIAVKHEFSKEACDNTYCTCFHDYIFDSETERCLIMTVGNSNIFIIISVALVSSVIVILLAGILCIVILKVYKISLHKTTKSAPNAKEMTNEAN